MSGDINKQACRVCLKEDAQPLHIFEKPSRKECFAMMLTSIADIKIYKGDSLPENLCNSCSQVLLKAYKLKVLAVKTNAYLHVKSKDIIIKKLDPELIKFKSPSQTTIKIEPKVKDLFTDDDIFSNKTKPKEPNIFDEKPLKKKAVKTDDFFSKPVSKNTKKTASKDDTFFIDNNINDNENESIFGHDDHFADNDDFDISYSTGSEPAQKKPRLTTPLTKKTMNQIANRTVVNRRAQLINKQRAMVKKKKILPKPKPKYVPKAMRDKSSSDSSLVCTVCGIVTKNITQHMRSHKEHKFTCPVCKMGFNKKSEYHLHEVTHGDVARTFICDVCPMRFFTNKALKRHKTNHGEKIYECDHCPYKIHSRWALRRHMGTHLGIKPFVCECGQAFVSRPGLASHSLTHTGEKPFECQICNVEFSYKSNLNNHVMKTHGVNIRFQSIHKVTEESLQMVLERAALEGTAQIVTECQTTVYSQSRSRALSNRKTAKTVVGL